MFASNALVNSCKMLDGTQLLVVKKASQKQKKITEKKCDVIAPHGNLGLRRT